MNILFCAYYPIETLPNIVVPYRDTVRGLLRRFRNTDSVENAARNGRPTVFFRRNTLQYFLYMFWQARLSPYANCLRKQKSA